MDLFDAEFPGVHDLAPPAYEQTESTFDRKTNVAVQQSLVVANSTEGEWQTWDDNAFDTAARRPSHWSSSSSSASPRFTPQVVTSKDKPSWFSEAGLNTPPPSLTIPGGSSSRPRRTASQSSSQTSSPVDEHYTRRLPVPPPQNRPTSEYYRRNDYLSQDYNSQPRRAPSTPPLHQGGYSVPPGAAIPPNPAESSIRSYANPPRPSSSNGSSSSHRASYVPPRLTFDPQSAYGKTPAKRASTIFLSASESESPKNVLPPGGAAALYSSAVSNMISGSTNLPASISHRQNQGQPEVPIPPRTRRTSFIAQHALTAPQNQNAGQAGGYSYQYQQPPLGPASQQYQQAPPNQNVATSGGYSDQYQQPPPMNHQMQQAPSTQYQRPQPPPAPQQYYQNQNMATSGGYSDHYQRPPPPPVPQQQYPQQYYPPAQQRQLPQRQYTTDLQPAQPSQRPTSQYFSNPPSTNAPSGPRVINTVAMVRPLPPPNAGAYDGYQWQGPPPGAQAPRNVYERRY